MAEMNIRSECYNEEGIWESSETSSLTRVADKIWKCREHAGGFEDRVWEKVSEGNLEENRLGQGQLSISTCGNRRSVMF